MRIALVVLATGLLSGCANVGTIQADCEKTSQTFPELATCLRTSVTGSDSSRMQNSPQVRLYLLKADQLSQRVQKGEITDLDARVELQTLYVNMQNQERANAAADAASRPKTTSCYAVGNTVQCTTF